MHNPLVNDDDADDPYVSTMLSREHKNHSNKTCDVQQFGILTSVDSDEPVKPPVKLRNSKLCSISSLTVMEYSSDRQV